MRETQATITAWIDETFGAEGSNARAAARANEELAEVLAALTRGEAAKVAEEAADVVIVLYRLASRLGHALVLRFDEMVARHARPSEIAASAAQEMVTLLRRLFADDDHDYAAAAMQRCVTDLCGLAAALGADLAVEIDRKMAINRARRWRHDGSGCGYHVAAEGHGDGAA